MLSEAKHLWSISARSDPSNLRFFASLRMTAVRWRIVRCFVFHYLFFFWLVAFALFVFAITASGIRSF